LMVYLLNRSELSATTTYVAMGAACAVSCGVWWCAGRLPIRVEFRRAWHDLRQNWSFSRWALASQLIGCITPYILPWILTGARGAPDTGTYAACTNLCGFATMFVVGLALALTPQAACAFASGGKPALLRILRQTAFLFLIGVGAFCIVVACCGDYAMTLIYGPRFEGTHLAVTLLSLAVLTNSFAIISGNGLWAVNRPQANLIADITVFVVTISIALLAIHDYGIVGAAAATFGGSAAGAITRFVVFRRVLQGVVARPATVHS